MHIFINLTSNLYYLAPLFLIVCPLSISSSFVLFPFYSSNCVWCNTRSSVGAATTDLYDTDDPVLERIPQHYSQPPHEFHTLFTEIQHHYFNDINLSQDILTNLTNSPSISNNTIDSNAINPASPKPIHTQSLPFFDPSFFAHCKAFDTFFLSSHTFLTVPILLQA